MMTIRLIPTFFILSFGLASLAPSMGLGAARATSTLATAAPGVADASAAAAAWGHPCTKTYMDGRTVQVASCGGDSESQVCCGLDEYGADAAGCVQSCVCSYTEHREGTREVVEAEHPVLLRGVPIFSQFDARSRNGHQPIGCGPIALTQLALYYDAWGFRDIGERYENSSGKVRWKKLARDAADALDTWVRNNASPTFMSKVESGIKELFDDLGYWAGVTHQTVRDRGSEEDDAFEEIKTSILQGRPVLIGFDIHEGPGGGIGGGGDNWGFIDHYGLIVGFDDTGSTPRIDINMGWNAVTGHFDGGTTVDQGIVSYDWDIGRGKIHLWFVRLSDSEKTVLADGSIDEVCTTPNPELFFTPTTITEPDGDVSHIGSTYEFNHHTPVMRDLIADSECSLLGGQVTREEHYDYVASWTDRISCGFRYNIYDDVLSGEWDPEVPDLPETVDQLDPLP